MGHGCGKAIEKPECLDELLEYAHILSEPFRHARVDFYITDRITFGEITFTNGAGFDKFSSYEFDRMMGDLGDGRLTMLLAEHWFDSICADAELA